MRNVITQYDPPEGYRLKIEKITKVIAQKADHILGSVVEKNWSYWKRIMKGKGKDRFTALRSKLKKYLRGLVEGKEVVRSIIEVRFE